MINELELDLYIGKKLYERRKELKMNLYDLGNAIGVSHQQITKYEKGINRVSAGTLWKIAKLLGVNITYFYKGANDGSVCVDTKNNTIQIKLPEFFEITTKDKQ